MLRRRTLGRNRGRGGGNRPLISVVVVCTLIPYKICCLDLNLCVSAGRVASCF